MKNKKKLLLLVSAIFFFIFEKGFAEQFIFDATEIQLSNNGNILNAKNGVKITDDIGTKITANNFSYNKTSLILTVEGDVKIYDETNDLIIFGEKFIYEKNNEKIFSESPIKAIFDNKYNLDARELTYFIKEKKITSDKKILFTDNFNNKIQSDNFQYLITDGIIKSNKFIYTDNIGNQYEIDSVVLNTKNNQIIGKDIEINFDKGSFGSNNNDPRLKGNALFLNKEKTKIKKGVFTTCKKNDTCPPWTMSAEEILHDKVKKTINYKNAFLKIYDKPVFYFPKFFHPDPTVKRQSGFLTPTFGTGGQFSIPYFKVISDSRDLTFKPRFYSFNSVLLNSEYRAVSENSTHIADIGFKNKESNSSNQNSSKAHFFSNSKFDNLKNSLFDESGLEVNLESVTNDAYLKVNKIDSPIVNNSSTLNSFINFNGINDDLYFKANLEVFEDLTKNSSDRYEYIFPNIESTKIINLDSKFNGDLTLDTKGYIKQYETNVKETSVSNNLNFESYPNYSTNGFLSNYSFIFINNNSELKSSKTSDNSSRLEALTAGMFTASYPLKKINKNFRKFFTPKASFRYSPSTTKNFSDANSRIDTNSVFALQRLSTVENGSSLTIGSEYLIKDNDEIDVFKLSLASVFRDKVNDDLPLKSTLGQKTSNIFGDLEIKPNEYFDIKYNFSLDNNLDRSTYDQIITKISINNFVNSFEFLEETGPLGDLGYWNNNTTLNINNQNSFSINKRRNTKTNLNEFYNLIYEYKNDCLTAAIQYNKNYYSDGDLKPSEELFFSLTIVPFTKINSPNINK
jgi:LPS-assembly protein